LSGLSEPIREKPEEYIQAFYDGMCDAYEQIKSFKKKRTLKPLLTRLAVDKTNVKAIRFGMKERINWIKKH